MTAMVILMSLFGVATAMERTIVILTQPPDFWDQFYARHPGLGIANVRDIRFASHRGLMLLHVLPGFLLSILGPWQFVERIRTRRLWLHRWSGRVFVAAAAGLGISGLALGFRTALGFGGPSETSAIIVFGALMLFSVGKALRHILRGETALHREWMMRAFAVGLSVGTVRVLSFVFYLSPAVRRAPAAYVGLLFWTGFLISQLVAELWIRHTRPAETAPGALPARARSASAP